MRLRITENIVKTLIRMAAVWFIAADMPVLRDWFIRFGVFCLWVYAALLGLTLWQEER
jgi:hypothetical protein